MEEEKMEKGCRRQAFSSLAAQGSTVLWKNWAGRSLHSLSMGTVWISQVTQISRISAITRCRYPDKSCPPQNQGEEQRSTVKCVRRPWQQEGVLQTEGFPKLNSELESLHQVEILQADTQLLHKAFYHLECGETLSGVYYQLLWS